jgi:hypothetical protein
MDKYGKSKLVILNYVIVLKPPGSCQFRIKNSGNKMPGIF